MTKVERQKIDRPPAVKYGGSRTYPPTRLGMAEVGAHRSRDAPITLQDHRPEWTHGNTVSETTDGNILVSFRNIFTVVMIERATGNIIWELGSPPLAHSTTPGHCRTGLC